jgi:hypothetical protein
MSLAALPTAALRRRMPSGHLSRRLAGRRATVTDEASA